MVVCADYPALLASLGERPRSVFERVTAQLQEKGHKAATLSAEQFGQRIEELKIVDVRAPEACGFGVELGYDSPNEVSHEQ